MNSVNMNAFSVSFPTKMYLLLEHMENEQEETGIPSCLKWNEDGKSFIIVCKKRFCREIVPRFFKQKRYSSFVRQLNIYGFKQMKQPAGQDRFLAGAGVANSKKTRYYCHPYFQRGRKELLHDIIRIPVKSAVHHDDSDSVSTPTTTKMQKATSRVNELRESIHAQLPKFVLPASIEVTENHFQFAPSVVSNPFESCPSPASVDWSHSSTSSNSSAAVEANNDYSYSSASTDSDYEPATKSYLSFGFEHVNLTDRNNVQFWNNDTTFNQDFQLDKETLDFLFSAELFS